MGHFVITFRLKADSTYDKRYDSFTDKIEEIAESNWRETSSFYAIYADGTAKEICDAIYYGSEFSEDTDTMIVIDLDNNEKATRGNIEYPHTLAKCLGF